MGVKRVTLYVAHAIVEDLFNLTAVYGENFSVQRPLNLILPLSAFADNYGFYQSTGVHSKDLLKISKFKPCIVNSTAHQNWIPLKRNTFQSQLINLCISNISMPFPP